jgi:hypothetical protein
MVLGLRVRVIGRYAGAKKKKKKYNYINGSEVIYFYLAPRILQYITIFPLVLSLYKFCSVIQ